MDNICHTLVGAVCGEAGLKTRSRFASATLMIAANLPDIDVAVFATSTTSVAFRRGITHGLLAQALLPPLLAVVMWTLARRRSRPGDPPAHLWWLVALSYLGVLSHVGLDYLNNYGVRLLMPVSGRWFYGDTLFIIDPWMWAAMGVGVWWSRRRGSPRPARNALLVTVVYVVLMLVAAGAARRAVVEAWVAQAGAPPRALMVGPRPLTPLVRDVILDAGDHYVTGTFSWLPTSIRFDEAQVLKNDQDPAVAEAARDPAVQGFLVWSRFPVWTLSRSSEGTLVQVGDMRFSAVQRFLGRSGFRAETVVR